MRFVSRDIIITLAPGEECEGNAFGYVCMYVCLYVCLSFCLSVRTRNLKTLVYHQTIPTFTSNTLIVTNCAECVFKLWMYDVFTF